MMHKNGFTLLELLFTLTVASIILTAGIPSFRGMIMDNRLARDVNLFVASAGIARSAAVRFQRNAMVCTSANFDAAVPTCSASTDWSNGWIVWVDKDRDAATDANEILSVQAPLNDAVTFTSTAADRFAYDGRGFGLSGADDLTLCDNRTAETGRVVSINNVGRTNVATQPCT